VPLETLARRCAAPWRNFSSSFDIAKERAKRRARIDFRTGTQDDMQQSAVMLPAAQMRRGVIGLLAIVALGCGVAVWHPARVAVQTLLLLPALFPSAPFDPESLVTSTPVREELSYVYAGGHVEASLFHPSGTGRHAALILLLGAGDLPRSDLAMHFADALARLGVVTLVPESSGMLAERLTFDEVDAVRTSLNALRDQADVDAERIGLVGLSASGGLSIVAAGQPDLRARVRLVNSFGSYDDATTLLVDVAARSIEVGGDVRAWQPESRTVEVLANALVDAGIDASLKDELLAGTTRARATQIIAALPRAVHERLAAISPTTVLAQLQAHVYLMHDVDDSFIPFTESRDLVARAPPGIVQRYTEFAIFAHVIPDRAVPWQTFLPDLWRLFWHVHAVLLELI
jgi:acetyl esterase/lipase